MALFACASGTLIAQNFSAAAADVRIFTLGISTMLKNLVTGEILVGQLPSPHEWNWRNDNIEDRVTFKTQLLPDSYAAFAMEKTAQTSAH